MKKLLLMDIYGILLFDKNQKMHLQSYGDGHKQLMLVQFLLEKLF